MQRSNSCLLETWYGARILEGSVREKKTADAYEVVGADLDASANEIKKRYWKLSLMIHPDKCDHPKAQEAFNALSQAAKNLQVTPACCPQSAHFAEDTGL